MGTSARANRSTGSRALYAKENPGKEARAVVREVLRVVVALGQHLEIAKRRQRRRLRHVRIAQERDSIAAVHRLALAAPLPVTSLLGPWFNVKGQLQVVGYLLVAEATFDVDTGVVSRPVLACF